jgi:hypothetical protein
LEKFLNFFSSGSIYLTKDIQKVQKMGKNAFFVLNDAFSKKKNASGESFFASRLRENAFFLRKIASEERNIAFRLKEIASGERKNVIFKRKIA